MKEIEFQQGSTLPVTEQILNSTARITATFEGGQQANGSGFFFQFCKKDGKHIPGLVTNKHVITGAKELSITFRMKKVHGEAAREDPLHLIIRKPIPLIRNHSKNDVDLAVVLIGEILNQGIKEGYKPTYTPIDRDLIPTDDEVKRYMIADTVLMVGYPNGLWDSKNNMPLVRRGIISTLPRLDYNGKPEFVVDMACLYGSSGSPVFFYDTNYHRHIEDNVRVTPKCKLLGILYGGPEYEFHNEFNEVSSSTKAPILNLGYIIKSSELLDFETSLNAERVAEKKAGNVPG